MWMELKKPSNPGIDLEQWADQEREARRNLERKLQELQVEQELQVKPTEATEDAAEICTGECGDVLVDDDVNERRKVQEVQSGGDSDAVEKAAATEEAKKEDDSSLLSWLGW